LVVFGVAFTLEEAVACWEVVSTATLGVSVSVLPGRTETLGTERSCEVCAAVELAGGAKRAVALADTGEIEDQSSAPLSGTASEPTRTTLRIWRALKFVDAI
jgi:hypothetical protein